MTELEFGELAAAIRTYYPKEKILPNEKAVTLWFKHLSDIPYNLACVVLAEWVSVNKWSPSISDIREGAARLMSESPADYGEGWRQVQAAISRFGMYRPEEALESISDPIAKEAVKRMGFYEICTSENPTAERANFRMIYEQLADRAKKDAQIPKEIKETIESIKYKMITGGHGNGERSNALQENRGTV
jgi:hypothetical protein